MYIYELKDWPRFHWDTERLAEPLAWEEVEAWLDGPVRALARQHVGLPAEPTTPAPPAPLDGSLSV